MGSRLDLLKEGLYLGIGLAGWQAIQLGHNNPHLRRYRSSQRILIHHEMMSHCDTLILNARAGAGAGGVGGGVGGAGAGAGGKQGQLAGGGGRVIAMAWRDYIYSARNWWTRAKRL